MERGKEGKRIEERDRQTERKVRFERGDNTSERI